jgi:hypothetical protein
MKLCLMILSVPWYIFNGLEHTAILSNFLTFITGSNSRLLRILTESIQLSHLARALANFRLIFSPSLKDAVPILRINFYRISL